MRLDENGLTHLTQAEMRALWDAMMRSFGIKPILRVKDPGRRGSNSSKRRKQATA